MNNAVTERTEQRRKKNKIVLAIVLIVAIVFIILATTAMEGNKIVDDTKFFIYLMSGIILLNLAIIPFSYNRSLKVYSNMIGMNLKAEITEEYIKLEDEVDSITIEKEFKWTDINNVVAQIYRAGFMKKTYCLKFVTNNENEYEKISKREKKEMPKSERRNLMLNSEFYIDSAKDDINRYLKYWGKRFESETLYYSQIKVKNV